MKFLYGILILSFSLPAFACSTYVCDIYGANGLKLKLDLNKSEACYAKGDPANPAFCSGQELYMKVVANRFGSSNFGKTPYPYFEVVAHGAGGLVADVRIYSNSQPMACGTEQIPLYPADIATSWSRPFFARNPADKVQNGDPVCYGLE